MKQKQILFMMIGVTALLALMAGCATTSQTDIQDKRSMLIAAGFKTITPKTQAQQQKLQQLQVGHVAQVQKKGKTYYVVADPPHNVVYVGGPTEYQNYQQMRAQRQLAPVAMAIIIVIDHVIRRPDALSDALKRSRELNLR